MTALVKVKRGQYRTADGLYTVESDVPSIGEWDEQRPDEWFVYLTIELERGIVGPPDALFNAPTLRECREWLAAQPASDVAD